MSKRRLTGLQRLPFICACTSVFSLMAHGYRYLSMSFSGDAMLLSQVGEELYQISLGRFLQPVYWQIRGYVTAPLLIGLFATAFLCLSAALIADLFHLSHPLTIALSCGMLAANETLAVSNATYLPWTDVYMLSMLFCVLGVFVFFRYRYGWLLSPVLYALSLGLYQSYLPVASTLVILLLLMETLQNKHHNTPIASIWKRGILACMTLVAGLLLYALWLNIAIGVTGAEASTDYNGVGRVSLPDIRSIPSLLLSTYLTPLRVLLVPDSQVMSWHITTIPAELHILLFGFAAVLLFMHMHGMPAAANLTSLFLLLILPLGMNFVQFIAKDIVSGLTIYAYHLLYLLPIALIEQNLPTAAGLQLSVSRLCRASCVCLLGILLFLGITVSNQMSVKRDLEFHATTSAMARVLDRAEQTQGYIPGETPVVLIGSLNSSSVAMERKGFESIAKAQGMRYTYGAAYETSNYWYLQMALGEPIHLVSHTQRRRLTRTAPDLAAFPREGCCQLVDGYLYLRLN